MRATIYVKLCDGRRVRHPDSQIILELGKTYHVKSESFWLRRLETGDVSLVLQESENLIGAKKKKEKAEGEK